MADISKEMAVQLAEAIVGREKANGILVSQWLEYAQAAFKLGRNSGLEEAVQILQKTGATLPAKQEREGGNAVLTGVSISMAAIESLKENTP